MDTTEFLRRVVPREGNYLTITWPHKQAGYGWPARSFAIKEDKEVASAVNLIGWTVREQIDAYYAVAAFTAAESRLDGKGKSYVLAPRKGPNVQLLRALFIDADVSRQGDGKDPAKVFPDRRAALVWLFDFCKTINLPKPSIIVDSGHGYHWYWTLVDALPTTKWQPLAQALKQAAIANRFTGDIQIVTDVSRLLRPVGSVNMKTGSAALVKVAGQPAADIPNDEVAQALGPWLIQTGQTQQATGTHSRQSASVTNLGPRPSHIPGGDTSMNDAASAGIEQREWKFAAIARQCEQVKQSLNAGGNGDNYHLWTAHHALAAFCVDGESYAHTISNQDPRYDEEKNHLKFEQTKDEIARKLLGAPRCEYYASCRTGVCETCTWFGKLNSPISLGVEDGDLPFRYRRRVVMGETRIEWRTSEGDWKQVITGDVYQPRLDRLATGGYLLSFIHEMGGKKMPIACRGAEMGHPLTVLGIVERQGISADRHNAGHVGDFVVAWINQLRTLRVERTMTQRPYGWNYIEREGKTERIGLAVAGTHYRRDGTEEHIPGGDPKIRAMYTPRGSYAEWRRVAAMFEGARADIQTLIACSPGSLLVSLCGDVRGMSLNFWSPESGLGKTSAMRFGQSWWGDFTLLQSMDDTPNAVIKSLSEPRVLIRYWDELRVEKFWRERWVAMVYTIPQGRERARMMSDTTLRETGEWEAMLVFTSNKSYADILMSSTQGTDSGLWRLLEIHMPKATQPFRPGAGSILKLAESNYGHAGRIFVKHVAQHAADIEAQLLHFVKAFHAKHNTLQEERFYITAIACIVVGAMIARRLGIFDFDVPGIIGVLERAFLRARGEVSRNTLLSPTGGYDLEQLIAEYYAETADVRLRTDVLSPRGKEIKVLATPRGEVVHVQFAEGPQMPRLRVARSHLIDWCQLHGLPALEIIDQLKRNMNASVLRATIGAGTRYTGMRILVVDIPLSAGMVDQLDPDDDSSEADEPPLQGHAKGKARRTQQPKGNEAVL
jgi:uncharacterized protein DUF927